jgi:hypothetical protein
MSACKQWLQAILPGSGCKQTSRITVKFSFARILQIYPCDVLLKKIIAVFLCLCYDYVWIIDVLLVIAVAGIAYSVAILHKLRASKQASCEQQL